MPIVSPPSIQLPQIVSSPLVGKPVICCHQKPIPDYDASANPTAIDSTNNSLNSRMVCFAPSRSAIGDIVLAYPGYGNNLPELDMPVTYTVTASIEYPIGTLTPVYAANGSRTLSVAPGRILSEFQPCPISIPAGAQFYVKSFVQWTGTLWLQRKNASYAVGEWTTRAIGATDNTLTTTNLAPSTGGSGFGPVVYGRLQTSCSVLGIIGDSISQSAVDNPNPITGAQAFDSALLGIIPVAQLGRSSDTSAFYLTRPHGRTMALRDRITHLCNFMGRNDMPMGLGFNTQLSNYHKIIDPFLARGVKVFGCTVTPYTTTTDNWTTLANQTVVSGREPDRQTWNSYLLANWRAIGLTGLFDFAHTVDPTDSGKWSVDGTAGNNAAGFATMSGGAIASVAYANYSGVTDNSGGSGYGNAQTGPCVVKPYPGDPGTGAVVTWTSNASGLVLTYTVTNGGSGYLYPPMVAPQGRWTNDGIHPTHRGYQEMIAGTSFGPAMFL